MAELELPKIGMGTWELKKQITARIVNEGLDIGYRLIDTAQIYGNESEVGDGITSSSIHRKNFILATKLWITNLSPKRVHRSFNESLRKLKTDYVDILYIHWPVRLTYRPKKTLKAMNELVKEGIVKHIGVSNFPIYRLKEALEVSETPIIANQVEMHPMLRLQKLKSFNDENKVFTIAYSPLGRGRIWGNNVLNKIGDKHNISIQQVCLAYLMKRGAIPIPKSSSRNHLQANFDAINLEIDDADVAEIEKIPEKRLINPPFGIKWDKD